MATITQRDDDDSLSLASSCDANKDNSRFTQEDDNNDNGTATTKESTVSNGNGQGDDDDEEEEEVKETVNGKNTHVEVSEITVTNSGMLSQPVSSMEQSASEDIMRLLHDGFKGIHDQLQGLNSAISAMAKANTEAVASMARANTEAVASMTEAAKKPAQQPNGTEIPAIYGNDFNEDADNNSMVNGFTAEEQQAALDGYVNHKDNWEMLKQTQEVLANKSPEDIKVIYSTVPPYLCDFLVQLTTCLLFFPFLLGLC